MYATAELHGGIEQSWSTARTLPPGTGTAPTPMSFALSCTSGVASSVPSSNDGKDGDKMSDPMGGRLQIFTRPSFPPVATRPIVVSQPPPPAAAAAAAAAAEPLHGSRYARPRATHTQTRKHAYGQK